MQTSEPRIAIDSFKPADFETIESVLRAAVTATTQPHPSDTNLSLHLRGLLDDDNESHHYDYTLRV